MSAWQEFSLWLMMAVVWWRSFSNGDRITAIEKRMKEREGDD